MAVHLDSCILRAALDKRKDILTDANYSMKLLYQPEPSSVLGDRTSRHFKTCNVFLATPGYVFMKSICLFVCQHFNIWINISSHISIQWMYVNTVKPCFKTTLKLRSPSYNDHFSLSGGRDSRVLLYSHYL